MGNDLLHAMNQRSDELNFRHLVATPAETIFSFWTDADRLVRWMGRRAEIEPSLGGLFIVDLTGDDIVFGRVVLIEPPNRLELAWGWGGEREPSIDPGSSRVELALKDGLTATTLRLTHRDVPQSHVEWQAAFWEHHLPRLELAATGEPVPSPTWSPSEPGE